MSHDPTRCYACEGMANDIDALQHAIRIALEDPFTELTSEVRSILTDALDPPGVTQ